MQPFQHPVPPKFKVPVFILLALCVFTLPFLAWMLDAKAQPMSQHGQAPLGAQIAQQSNRACVYPPGGWTIVDCSAAAAAQSAALTVWARYVVQCGDDSYVAWGDEATDEADSSDGWVPLGAWTDFFTTPSSRYFSCLNKNVDSDCRYIRCQ